MHRLIERQRPAIAEVCRRYRVRRLDVFGSGARGTDFDPECSDVDFLLEFAVTDRGPTLKTYFALRDELQPILGRRVDLVMANGVTNPYVKAELEQTREEVYAA